MTAQRLTSYCGLDCGACKAYVATRNNDTPMIENTAREWSELYHSSFTARDVWCDGCTSETERLCGYCAECGIRACARQHRVTNCGACPEYACDTIRTFIEMVPDIQPVLDRIHRGIKP